MKFKLDENLDARLAADMLQRGMDGDTVLGEALSGVSDEALFEVCKKTGRVLKRSIWTLPTSFVFRPNLLRASSY